MTAPPAARRDRNASSAAPPSFQDCSVAGLSTHAEGGLQWDEASSTPWFRYVARYEQVPCTLVNWPGMPTNCTGADGVTTPCPADSWCVPAGNFTTLHLDIRCAAPAETIDCPGLSQVPQLHPCPDSRGLVRQRPQHRAEVRGGFASGGAGRGRLGRGQRRLAQPLPGMGIVAPRRR